MPAEWDEIGKESENEFRNIGGFVLEIQKQLSLTFGVQIDKKNLTQTSPLVLPRI